MGSEFQFSVNVVINYQDKEAHSLFCTELYQAKLYAIDFWVMVTPVTPEMEPRIWILW